MAIEVKVKKMHPDAQVPVYMTAGAACMDIFSYEECTLIPGETRVVGTGLQFEVPIGYEMQVRPRSGLAAKFGVTVLNTPGTLDADYRGELKIILVNHGDKSYEVKKGDRIAQAKISKVEEVLIIESEELSTTERGSGGLGHTG